MSAPLILSVVGKSDSGKTTLILKLLPELKKRRYRIAVAKHCPHGFDLDIETEIALFCKACRGQAKSGGFFLLMLLDPW